MITFFIINNEAGHSSHKGDYERITEKWIALSRLHFIYTFTTHVVILIMSDEVRIADVTGKKVQWDPAQMRKIQEHP